MPDLHTLVAGARYEIIPLKSAEAQLAHLPAGAPTSVTCSPTKGQQATFELAARLLELGHPVVPHVSARLAAGRAAPRELAVFCRNEGITEVFLVAGDATEAAGPYEGVVPYLRDLLDCDHGLRGIGVAGYPDGHAFVEATVVHEALHAKQALLAEAGVPGWATTQMCFDLRTWTEWASAERAEGLTLPLHVGVPGVIDRTKLLTTGLRLGVGASLRFVKKQGGTISRLVRPGGYDPLVLVGPLAELGDSLGIEGVHLFTFNNVDDTAAWQRHVVAGQT